MKTWITTAAVVAAIVAPLAADVTLVQTMTVEGAAAALLGGKMPRMTTQIKGLKSRIDIDVNGQGTTVIADIAAKQVIILNPGNKTATVMTPQSAAPGKIPAPEVEGSYKRTGKTQVIEGQQCSEYALTVQVSMAEAGGRQMSSEAAAAMKDVRMVLDGSLWIAPDAPGASEYTAFNKAALDSKLLGAITGMAGAKPGTGIDKLIEAAAAAPGLPYLTDISMRFEGTGPVVDAMKQMGGIRVVQKLTTVSTQAIADSAFEVPAGYEVVKK